MMKISEKVRSLLDDLDYYTSIPNRLYKTKCFLWHRYSTVKPRWLPHTWVDRDYLLLYTGFEILCRFFEDEKPLEYFEDTPERLELHSIYKWWISADRTDMSHDEKELAKHYLKRVIDLCDNMWT